MPQFDTYFFFSQIFWCLTCFGLLWAGMHYKILPLFQKILSEREGIITQYTQEAKENEHKAQQLLQETQKRFDTVVQDSNALKETWAEEWRQRFEHIKHTEKKQYEEDLEEFQSKINNLMTASPDDLSTIADTLVPIIVDKIFSSEGENYESVH